MLFTRLQALTNCSGDFVEDYSITPGSRERKGFSNTNDGDGFHNPDTAARYLDVSEEYLENPGDRLDHQTWRYKEGFNERIKETKEIINKLRGKLR